MNQAVIAITYTLYYTTSNTPILTGERVAQFLIEYVIYRDLASLILRPPVQKSGRGPGIFSHVSDIRIERMVERV